MYKGKERRKKERRKIGKMVRTVIIDMPLDEFVSKHVGFKRDGISIFKTVMITKILS